MSNFPYTRKISSETPLFKISGVWGHNFSLVDALEKKFSSWDWKYGRKLPFQYQMYRRFSWGDVELQFQVNGGRIEEVNAFSDGMDPAFVAALPGLWRDCAYEVSDLCEAMEGFEGSSPLISQMKEDIRQLLCENI